MATDPTKGPPVRHADLPELVQALIVASGRTDEQVTNLAARVQNKADAIRAQTRALRLLTFVVALLMAGAYWVILDNRDAIADNNRKLCPILELMVPQPGQPARTTPAGRDIAARATALASDPDYDCI